MRRLLAPLAFLGRYGTQSFALSLVVGLALPGLATAARPLLSVTIFTFLVLTFWGVITGFGVDDVDSLINSEELPGLALAHKLWGGAWWLILAAFFTSTLVTAHRPSPRSSPAAGRHGDREPRP